MNSAFLIPLGALALALHQPADAQSTIASQQAASVLVSTTWLNEDLRDEKLVILHVGNEAARDDDGPLGGQRDGHGREGRQTGQNGTAHSHDQSKG